MGRYFYPSAPDALSAKKMFLREHGYRIPQCFRNTWGSGFVLFDSKADVNSWYKEHTGEPFYKEEYEPGTVFTKQDAYREIDGSYGSQIEEVLRQRDFSLSTLAMGVEWSRFYLLTFTTWIDIPIYVPNHVRWNTPAWGSYSD